MSTDVENVNKAKIVPTSSLKNADDLIDPFVPGNMSNYRISLFAVGREELVSLLPDQREIIQQFTDLQVEELAMQLEDALTEIYKMTLRAVLVSYLQYPSTRR